MKSTIKYIVIIFGIIFLGSCEDIVEIELPVSDPVVVIDAWINDKPESQSIKVLKSLPYFENTFLPGINEAIVKVEDLTDNIMYDFEKGEEDGVYNWNPSAERPTFGKVGNEYKLSVQVGNGLYESYSMMNRVPVIDSINFRFLKLENKRI